MTKVLTALPKNKVFTTLPNILGVECFTPTTQLKMEQNYREYLGPYYQ